MAALGVRLDSQQPLVLGLVGLSLAQADEDHEALLVAPLHRRSAEKLGLDAGRVFDAAAGRTDLAGARWLAEMRDCEDQPEDAGYVEDDDGEGFRYERDGGRGLGLPLAAGALLRALLRVLLRDLLGARAVGALRDRACDRSS